MWHLLQIYAHYGLNDFILCLGYLGAEIKRYFVEHYFLPAAQYADLAPELDLAGDYQLNLQHADGDELKITFAETGLDTNIGGRIKGVVPYLGGAETFCVTYGDEVANIDLGALLEFHQAHKRLATLTVVHPRSNFGVLKLDAAGAVTEFAAKPVLKEWINGGFFVFNRPVLAYLDDDSVLERQPLERLSGAQQLMAYPHRGFWKCLDTYKDNAEFNQLWNAGAAEWKVWK